MTQQELTTWIKRLIAENELWKFYKSKEFRELQRDVLKEQHNECQICKQRGVITRADTVHHNQYVRTHPELALSKTYVVGGKEYRNLIAVCKSCHNKIHKEKGYIRNTIKVVTGFPGCGKTTYVQRHRLPEEPVYDLDYIVEALSLRRENNRDVMAVVGNCMLAAFVSECRERNLSAWVIRAAPNADDMELFTNVRAVYIDIPFNINECQKRRNLSDKEAAAISDRYAMYQSMKSLGNKEERW